MASFQIDPRDGAHAAAKFSDQHLDWLHRVICLELAVRLDREDFIEHVKGLITGRADQDDIIEGIRSERDLRAFAGEVRADLDKLPIATEGEPEDGRPFGGLYG